MLIIDLVNVLFGIFYVLLLISILLSWIRPNPYHPVWGPIIRITRAVVDPVLNPIRRLVPPMGGLDFSPMVLLLIIRVLQQAIVNILLR